MKRAAALAAIELPFSDAGNRLVEGTLDAMFDNTIQPTESAARALRAGASLIPIAGAPFS